MRKPGGNHRLGGLALDERHAERRKRMRPSDQDRQPQSVAPRLDARREKAEELARHGARPDQHRASIAPEQCGGGKREGRLVEHVGDQRTGGKLAPFVGDVGKLREPSPLDGKRIDRITIGNGGAPRPGNGRRRVHNIGRVVGRRVDRHERLSDPCARRI